MKANRNQNVADNQAKLSESLTDQQRLEVDQLCDAAGQIDTTPDLEGNLAFDAYLKVFRIIVALQVRCNKRIDDQHKLTRRAALGDND